MTARAQPTAEALQATEPGDPVRATTAPSVPRARLRARVEGHVGRRMLTLPEPVIRALAGPLPRRADGIELDPVTAFSLRLDLLARRPRLESLDPVSARRAFGELALAAELEVTPLAAVEDRTFLGPAGVLAARIYRPALEPAMPALLYLHGGGFLLGDLDSHDTICRALAKASGAVVIAATYRLAPEHRFPAAVEDALAALRFVAGRAKELGIDPARLALGGDSAGGNLTAVVCQLARDAGGPSLRAQLLVYPAVDMSRSMPSHQTLGYGYFLTQPMMDWFLGQYLRSPADLDDPRASPIRGRLDDLPPALVVVAGFDPLRDEGLAYAEGLRAAGGRAEVLEEPRLIHGFLSMAGVVAPARRALDEIGVRLARMLA